jgi:hypothetical protein
LKRAGAPWTPVLPRRSFDQPLQEEIAALADVMSAVAAALGGLLAGPVLFVCPVVGSCSCRSYFHILL